MAMLTCRVSDALFDEIVAEAARRGMRRSAVVVERLSRTGHEIADAVAASSGVVATVEKKPAARAKKAKPVESDPLAEAIRAVASGVEIIERPAERVKSSACPECLSVSGHQKWCSKK